jgi:hypothetical protein
MSEITIFDVLLIALAFFCLIPGLAIKWHKNLSFFVYSCYYVLSDIINPTLFMLNEENYSYYGWGAVRSFDFSMTSLVKSYGGSYFVFSVIALLSILFSFSGLLKNSSPAKMMSSSFKNKSFIKKNNTILYFFCFSLLIVYYFLYKYRIGITGVEGELPFHLSGAVHYFRIYIISIILAIIVSRSQVNWQMILTVFLYAFVAGIAASSRLIVVITISTLVFQFAYSKRFTLVFISLFFVVFMWFIISTSRELTFSNTQYDLFEVIYYTLTENNFEDLIDIFDKFTGRLSGAQQIVLAYQFRGFEGCSFIVDFFNGQSVCKNTIGDVYGFDLSGTSYGLGLSIIPSILISGKGLLDYLLPAVVIFIFISLTELLYRTAISNLRHPSIGFIYFFLSITFLFTGPLLYYYYLQFAAFFSFIVFKLFRKFARALKSTSQIKTTVVKNTTIPN